MLQWQIPLAALELHDSESDVSYKNAGFPPGRNLEQGWCLRYCQLCYTASHHPAAREADATVLVNSYGCTDQAILIDTLIGCKAGWRNCELQRLESKSIHTSWRTGDKTEYTSLLLAQLQIESICFSALSAANWAFITRGTTHNFNTNSFDSLGYYIDRKTQNSKLCLSRINLFIDTVWKALIFFISYPQKYTHDDAVFSHIRNMC